MDYKQALNSWFQSVSPYAAGKTFEYVMEKYGFKREEILRLAGNESTIGTSQEAIKAAQEANLSSNFYDEPKSESLIKALENHFLKAGLDIKDLGIVVGNGMDSVIEHAFMLFTKAGDSIVNMPPSFIYYDFTAARHGVEVIQVPRIENTVSGLKVLSVDINAVIKSIKPNTKIVFLCSPNNPDGNVVSLGDIERLAGNLLEKNIILFVDHAYIEFANKYDAKTIIHKYPNMIIGYTFSKAYALAGFRVGYALMHKSLQATYLSAQTPFLCARPSLKAAAAALLDKTHFDKIIANNIEGRAFLTDGLKQSGFEVYSSEANFILFQHLSLTAAEIMEKLLSQGIIIRAMSDLGPKTLRVTVGRPEENQRFLKAISAL